MRHRFSQLVKRPSALMRLASLAALTLLLAAPATFAQTGGTVTIWGTNNDGRATPPAGLDNVASIAAGRNHSIAVITDGTVVAWGRNLAGQATVPTGLTGVTAASGGEWHSLALKSDGTVVAWGRPDDGATTVPGTLSGVVAISAGIAHSLALKSDGTVVGWGRNTTGQATPTGGLTGVTAISGGADHSIALKSDGTVVAWGSNAQGQLNIPAGLSDVVAISAGNDHSLALTSDGTVVAWGGNGQGQSTLPAGLGTVQAIAAGGWSSHALQTDGTVVGWGFNNFQQTEPPAGLVDVVALSAGFDHTMALIQGGSTLTVAPRSAVYWPLDEVVLDIDAANAPFYSFSGDLGYAAAEMTALASESVVAGSLLDASGGAPLIFPNDDDAGTYTFSAGRTDGSPVSGDGTALTFRFTLRDLATPGPIALPLTNVDAITETGATFTFDEILGGAITVGGVWPGDFDEDGTVTPDDLLELGPNDGETGDPRAGTREENLQWGPKAFSPWGGSSADPRFPLSFIDGDGNGTIDERDLFALTVNMGATHDVPRTAASAGLVAAPVQIPLAAPVGSTVAFELALPADADGLLGFGIRFAHGTGATILAIEPGSLFEGALRAQSFGDAEAAAAFTHMGRDNAVDGGGTLVRVVARVDAPDASVSMVSVKSSSADGGVTILDPGTGVIPTAAHPVAAADGPGAALDVALAPNPARGAARLALTTAEAGPATVQVFDALGRQVADLRQAVAAGTTTFELPVARLAPGVYVVRVTAPAGIQTRTLTVAR